MGSGGFVAGTLAGAGHAQRQVGNGLRMGRWTMSHRGIKSQFVSK